MAWKSATSSDAMTLPERPSAAGAKAALALLMVASVVSLIDRQILSLLLIPIRNDLGLSDTGVSLLQGLAFAVVYCLAGLPIGYAVDRFSRRNIVIAGILFWSAMTALCGLATAFWLLFIARVGVGLGEACLHPAAYSLISDLFPAERRGRAYAAFGAAGTIGISASLFGGAAVIALIGPSGITLWPFGHLPMWQAAFLAVSLPGFVLAVVLPLLREPPRLEHSGRASASGFFGFVRANRGVIGVVFLCYGLISFAGYGAIAWMATGYVRQFGLSLARAGVVVGAITLAASVVGAIVGGLLTDRWHARGVAGGRFLMVVPSGIVGALAFAAWWSANSFGWSVAGGIVAFSMQVAAATTAPSVVAALAPNEYRGQLAAFYLLVTGLFGIAAGPTAIALITDHVFADDAALRWSIICATVPALLLAALVAWTSRGYYSREAGKWQVPMNGMPEGRAG